MTPYDARCRRIRDGIRDDKAPQGPATTSEPLHYLVISYMGHARLQGHLELEEKHESGASTKFQHHRLTLHVRDAETQIKTRLLRWVPSLPSSGGNGPPLPDFSALQAVCMAIISSVQANSHVVANPLTVISLVGQRQPRRWKLSEWMVRD